MRDIERFAREGDVTRVVNARVKGSDESSALRRRVAWPHDAADPSEFILEESRAAKADGGISDVSGKGQRALIIEADVEVHSHKHASAWVWGHVGNHHRAQGSAHARPAENPAVQRRTEVERLE